MIGMKPRIADGHDPSWLWDVAFERLRDRLVIATGERCSDLAVRLRHTRASTIGLCVTRSKPWAQPVPERSSTSGTTPPFSSCDRAGCEQRLQGRPATYCARLAACLLACGLRGRPTVRRVARRATA